MSRNLGGVSSGRWSPFQAVYSEDDIRLLAGPAAFKQGDAWQRAGHVRHPAFLETGIGAEVVGTWQRADNVTASASGNRIRTACSCESGEFCRHAVALLLHWLRSPTSFRRGGPASELGLDSSGGEDGGADEDEESLAGEFARFLAQDTMTHLRQIARERGLQVTARNKAELIEQLVRMLSTPESVYSAIMSLDDDARIALAAIALANIEETSTREAIGKAYQALGGTGKMRQGTPVAAETLVDRGLVFTGDRYAQSPSTYIMPGAVTGPLAAWMRREGYLRNLLRPAGTSATSGGDRKRSSQRFTLLESFQVIVHEVVRGAIGVHTPVISRTETALVPPGWRNDPTQSASAMPATPRGLRNQQPPVRRLTPLPSVITHADLRHLIELTGLPGILIEFAVELMLGLGILHIIVEPSHHRVQARPDLLQALLSVHPLERVAIMSDMYVDMADTTDLRAIVGPKRPLQLQYRSSYYSSVAPYQPQDRTVRNVLALLLAWLAEEEERWYDVASLLDLFWTLGPSLLGQSAAHYGEWWFSPSEQPDTRLNLEVREDWERVMRPLLTTMLTGPLTWLGLVDVAPPSGSGEPEVGAGSPERESGHRERESGRRERESGRRERESGWPELESGWPAAFRTLPASRVLVGELTSTDMELPAGEGQYGGAFPPSPLAFDVAPTDGGSNSASQSLTVFVPAGSPDLAIHTLLSTIGDLEHISREGLRYLLTPGRLQPIFESGVGGSDLVNALTRRAGGPLPDAVRETLERWWASYGTIRLYDDVTLIELGDDVLLRELRATSSLDKALVHIFSPRLIAIDGGMVQDLVAELRRLGHTPRIVEEAGQPVPES